jgi:hypothetical protein
VGVATRRVRYRVRAPLNHAHRVGGSRESVAPAGASAGVERTDVCADERVYELREVLER